MVSVSLTHIRRMGEHEGLSLGWALVVSLVLHALCLHFNGTTSSRIDRTAVSFSATISGIREESVVLVSAEDSDKPNDEVPSRPSAGRSNAVRGNAKDTSSLGRTRIYEVDELDVRPAILTWTMPEYPPSVSNDVAAAVVVEFAVDESGDVANIAVIEASGPPEFEQSVRLAFSRAKFTPGYLAHRPVVTKIRIKVDFNEDR